MAESIHNYRIKENLLKKSLLSGFIIGERGQLQCDLQYGRHVLITRPIDGIEEEAKWGRLRFNYDVNDERVLTVYAIASDSQEAGEYLLDPEIPIDEKRKFLESRDAVKAVNKTDILLYSQTGKFLYIVMDMFGVCEAEISNIQVNNKADLCMEALPEVYQEYGSFLHRYLSIYSSMLIDLQEKIRDVHQLLDVDTAPKNMLPVLAHWMGIDVSGDFLEESRLRTLVREAYQLKRMKGTKAALERLMEIVLDEKVVILEKNVFRNYCQTDDYKIYKGLYGDRSYDVTVLINTYVPESQKSQLLFLVNQFKPVRCRLLLYFLDSQKEMDAHVYMDMNAQTQEVAQSAVMDDRVLMDDVVLFEE